MKRTEWLKMLLFPPHCPGCGQLLPALSYVTAGREVPLLCDDCRDVWERETTAPCPLCGKTMFACACVPQICMDNGCASARKLFRYQPHHTGTCTSRVIFALKERLTSRVTDGLAEALAPAVREICAAGGVEPAQAVVTFLPRRTVARVAYGYDQAQMLARAVARTAGTSFMPLLARAPHSQNKAQKQLGRQDRIKAAGASYVPTNKVLPQGTGLIILVDDIITTGSGIAACSAILKNTYRLPLSALVLGMTYLENKTNESKNN